MNKKVTATTSSYLKDKPKKSNKSQPTYKTSTQCVCPRCGKPHNRMLYWTGRGIPRKYCPSCEHNDELKSPEHEYKVNLVTNYALGIEEM